MPNPNKKQKKIVIKTGNKVVDKLYEAVRDYVESKGGSVVVIGGIQIVQMPDDLKYNWGLNIRITGKKPILIPTKSSARKGK